MRDPALINKASPCDIDFNDKTMWTPRDFSTRPRVPCTNYLQCLRRSPDEGIMCYRKMAVQMARFILKNRSSFEEAVQIEQQDFLADSLDGNFWVYREGRWEIVKGKKHLIKDIVEFALVVIDFQPGDRRPLTKDGMLPVELGPGDAMHNAMLDLDDVYGEIGRKNPFRQWP